MNHEDSRIKFKKKENKYILARCNRVISYNYVVTLFLLLIKVIRLMNRPMVKYQDNGLTSELQSDWPYQCADKSIQASRYHIGSVHTEKLQALIQSDQVPLNLGPISFSSPPWGSWKWSPRLRFLELPKPQTPLMGLWPLWPIWMLLLQPTPRQAPAVESSILLEIRSLLCLQGWGFGRLTWSCCSIT